MNTYGFIGCGNMGGAVAIAISKTVGCDKIYLANRTESKAKNLAKSMLDKDCVMPTVCTNQDIAKECTYIYLGVKPQMMEGMLADIKDELAKRTDHFVLITMAAALTISDIRKMAGGEYPVIRIMPNTPVSIGEGVIMYSVDDKVSAEDIENFKNSLKKGGLLVNLPENLIDAGSALAGCGPAFVQMFIQALADGGVACGLPRAQAVALASQTVLGSAKLTLSTGKNPEELKDAVCSPAGSTIQGVRSLEENGFRGAAMDAVIASYDRTLAMKKK